MMIFFLVLSYYVLNSMCPWGGVAMAGFDSITTSSGASYIISDYTASFSTASSDCIAQSSQIADFTDNAAYRDFVDYLVTSGAYNSQQIWVSISQSGSKYYFTGGEEINSGNWFSGEPNFSCSGACCYRLVKRIGWTTASEHRLADNTCSNSYNFACKATPTTTTTTTTATTTTTTSTTTTTTTMMIPTTTTPITTPAPTTTTPLPTTITAVTTATFSTTTSTEAPTTTASSPMTSISQSQSTESVLVDLTKGEQMTVLYLGIIVGGSLTISCICSTCWLILFRAMKRRREGNNTKDDEEVVVTDSESESD